jgi:hypothetical protein
MRVLRAAHSRVRTDASSSSILMHFSLSVHVTRVPQHPAKRSETRQHSFTVTTTLEAGRVAQINARKSVTVENMLTASWFISSSTVFRIVVSGSITPASQLAKGKVLLPYCIQPLLRTYGGPTKGNAPKPRRLHYCWQPCALHDQLLVLTVVQQQGLLST